MDQEQQQRLDQSLTEGAQALLQAFLDKFPDIRTVAVALDYHLDDPGSLPVGTWRSSRPLTTDEVIDVCTAVDKVGYIIRRQHDAALRQHANELGLQQKEETTDGKEEQ